MGNCQQGKEGHANTPKHKNKALLVLLCQYGQLGIDISRELQRYQALERYVTWVFRIAQKLNDPQLMAGVLLRHGSAFFEKGDFKQAKERIDRAGTYTRISSSLSGSILLEAGRIDAGLRVPNALTVFDKAIKIAEHDTKDEDPAFVKLTKGFCYLRAGNAFMLSKDYDIALNMLDAAEEGTTPAFLRRKCAIQVMQAEILYARGEELEAITCARAALALADTIHSPLYITYIARLYALFKKSSIRVTNEMQQLGQSLSLFYHDMRKHHNLITSGAGNAH